MDHITSEDIDMTDYYEEFSDWIMKNYPICNGDMLVEFLEDDDIFQQFLNERELV